MGGQDSPMAHLKQHSPSLKIAALLMNVAFLMGDSIPSSLAGFRLTDLRLPGYIGTAAVPKDLETFALQHWSTFLENLESPALFMSFVEDLRRPRRRGDFLDVPVPIVREETPVVMLKCAKRLQNLNIEVNGFEMHSLAEKLEKAVLVLGLRHPSLRVVSTTADPESIKEDLKGALPGLETVKVDMWH
ncbi:hypothetical protein FRB99_000509 [Tulasnella sp. 403]|nr:hypothetical protein FRB99_000509 [Tulasnella sp. 403]